MTVSIQHRPLQPWYYFRISDVVGRAATFRVQNTLSCPCQESNSVPQLRPDCTAEPERRSCCALKSGSVEWRLIFERDTCCSHPRVSGYDHPGHRMFTEWRRCITSRAAPREGLREVMLQWTISQHGFAQRGFILRIWKQIWPKNVTLHIFQANILHIQYLLATFAQLFNCY